VALLAEAGQSGLGDLQHRFAAAGGESGDEYEYSDLIAKEFATDHHKIHIEHERLEPAVDGAIGAMSEPMVSHDCVAFYLLSQEVSRHVTVVQSGQGADEIFAGYDWYPPLADVPGTELWTPTHGSSSTGRTTSSPLCQPPMAAGGRSEPRLRGGVLRSSGAETTLDAALRIDSRVMLVDDPVKRVDNMTMAWALEARVPFLDHEVVELAGQCPPELKLAEGGKGVLKAASRGVVPDAVIDRPRDTSRSPACATWTARCWSRCARRSRHRRPGSGLFRPEAVSALLADPEHPADDDRRERPVAAGSARAWLQRVGACDARGVVVRTGAASVSGP
jgi:asparagine synthase (glutamine-hydrolysing)